MHDSELTRALESLPATAPTPTGSGTTGYEWWPSDWRYGVMPESVKEVLRSDGTAYTVVGDSNIAAGLLLSNGVPRYPILISLAAEAIRDDMIGPLTNYVAAGGFLFVGSSSFTRHTNGVTRGNFAFANELGVSMVVPGLTNWADNRHFNKEMEHRLTAHIPAGQLEWRMPASSEEIVWGVSPSHPFIAPHDIWRVQTNGATVLGRASSSGLPPSLLVRPYGKGCFIYYAPMQPLIGHGGFAPTLYSYLIFRRAIEWAFETARMPIPKVSPWPYQYDAAFMVRHDLENYTNLIANIEASARFEYTNGAKGDYYFCTGTVREDAPDKNSIIAGLRRAMTNYGATICPHNGGLRNPRNPSLVRGDYDYWHWGPDEALDVTPSGYSSGKAYAFTSISNSFRDVEGWLPGLMTNGMRLWVSCYFNATREDSYDIQEGLGVKIAGEQKLGPFPHWTLSTRTPGKRYKFSSQPVSDWFVGTLVAQSLEPWHPPGVHNVGTLRAAIDFYYELGGLINIYSHTLSTGQGDAGQLASEYVLYGMNTNLHPRLWSANAIDVFQWWQQRSNVQINASCQTNGLQTVATLTVSGALSPNTAVEWLVPYAFCGLEVLTNGNEAPPAAYRVRGQTIKVRVGTSVSNVVIKYYPVSPGELVYIEDFDAVTPPALPAGWSTSATGAQSPWATQTALRDTAPNAVACPAPNNVGLADLVSAPITLAAGQAQLTFLHYHELEASYDGGVLELKLGTNEFADILTLGGTFVTGGYNGVLDTRFQNPLSGRPAWTGTNLGFIVTSVRLPVLSAPETVRFRWRCGTDNSTPGGGWRVDTVSISNEVCLCCASNTQPVLPMQPDITVAELETLVVTNTATDLDVPAQTLTYALISPPAGA
ncbi:MAG TPA: hypothetical protein P5038_17160, partial [Candidatus Paceibacterota bacterium]|nr:hypothetical protein [Candidatus Paceibacterota bacterium]